MAKSLTLLNNNYYQTKKQFYPFQNIESNKCINETSPQVYSI